MTASAASAVAYLSPPQPFDHLGLLYRDFTQYLAGTLTFVRSALTARQPVLVAVPGHNLTLIRQGLAGDADRVDFIDMAVDGRNPGRIIPSVLLAFMAKHPGRRVSIIGEPIWPGRTDLEYPACAAHEALINAVCADRDAEILCPYDAQRLSPGAVADAARTHPTLADDAQRWTSVAYRDPVSTAAEFNIPVPAPPDSAEVRRYRDVHALATVRQFVQRQAMDAGLSIDQVANLSLAVNELVTNTLEHTDGPGLLRIWREPGLLVCQIDDQGYLSNPLAGRIPPPTCQDSGRGLILVNQLCDLVRVHTRPGGTSIRVQMTTAPEVSRAN